MLRQVFSCMKLLHTHSSLLQYTYSGLRLEPERWHPSIASLKRQVQAVTGATFNSCLLNYYRRWALGGCCGWLRCSLWVVLPARPSNSMLLLQAMSLLASCAVPPQRRRLHWVAQRQRAPVRTRAHDRNSLTGRSTRVPAAPQRGPPGAVPLPPGRRRAAGDVRACAGAGGCCRRGALLGGGCCGRWVQGLVDECSCCGGDGRAPVLQQHRSAAARCRSGCTAFPSGLARLGSASRSRSASSPGQSADAAAAPRVLGQLSWHVTYDGTRMSPQEQLSGGGRGC